MTELLYTQARNALEEILEYRRLLRDAEWWLREEKKHENGSPIVCQNMPRELIDIILPIVRDYYYRKLKKAEEEFEKL